MSGKLDKAHSKELLKVEAHMSDTPRFLCLNNDKPIPQRISTYRPQPSSVLQKARDFLPQIAKANKDLEEKIATLPSDAFDIENVNDSDGPHIEMNIAIMKREDSDSTSLSDLSGTESCLEDDDENKSDDEVDKSANLLLSSSAKTKTKQASLFPLDESNIKLPGIEPSLKKQSIEVLSASSTVCSDQEQSKEFCVVDTVR